MSQRHDTMTATGTNNNNNSFELKTERADSAPARASQSTSKLAVSRCCP